MAISQKTRKILWGRSGNRCTRCQKELVEGGCVTGLDTVIGDECHIISKTPGGLRSNPEAVIDFDGYDNLILLCKNCHKFIDDQPQIFTSEYLRKMKNQHEAWIRETLGNGAVKFASQEQTSLHPAEILLPRVYSGKQLVAIVRGAYFYEFSTVELENQDEVELVGGFCQELQNYGDILDELEVGGIIWAEFHLTQLLKSLEARGFWVFAARIKKKIKIKDDLILWEGSGVKIVRENDPTIIKVDLTSLSEKS
ncbi:MAG: HNH endonuclease signature motif containing protein [Bacillota bacterium]